VHASSPRTTAMTSRIHLRAKTNFASFFSLIWVVQSSREIYSASLLPPIGGYLPRPALLERGVRVVTDVECGMRWTQMRLLDEQRVGGRRSRVVLAPRRWR
jgi:hypothetical protein